LANRDCQAQPRRVRGDWEELNGGSASPATMPKGRRRRKVNNADGKP